MIELQVLNAVMRLHESNIRNLHWNSSGEEFDDAHKVITEEYYELLSTNIDKVSEIMGMLGINPPNYIEVISILKDPNNGQHMVVNSGKLYNRTEIIKTIDTIFSDITDSIVKVLENQDIQDSSNAGIKAELENILYDFDFQRRYINRRRLQ